MQTRASPLLSACLCLTACASAPTSPPPDTVEERIDAVVAAYGGADALAKLGASRVLGVVEPHVRKERGTGSVRRDYAAPGRLRVEVAYAGSTELRLLDGPQAWRGDPARLAPVSGPPHVAMRYQLLRLQPACALDANRERTTLHRAGPRPVLRLVDSPSLTLDYTLDPASDRVVRVDALLRFGGAALRFATDYTDFREVEGALVPFAEENHASGRRTGSTRLRSVELGVADLGPFAPN